MSLTLSPDELRELTGKHRPRAQARALDALGIAYRERPGDGILLVARAAAEAALGVKQRPAANDAPVEWEVDTEAIRRHGKTPTAH